VGGAREDEKDDQDMGAGHGWAPAERACDDCRSLRAYFHSRFSIPCFAGRRLEGGQRSPLPLGEGEGEGGFTRGCGIATSRNRARAVPAGSAPLPPREGLGEGLNQFRVLCSSSSCVCRRAIAVVRATVADGSESFSGVIRTTRLFRGTEAE
jgi:hypothetical protein